jgi:hypothetical protein
MIIARLVRPSLGFSFQLIAIVVATPTRCAHGMAGVRALAAAIVL